MSEPTFDQRTSPDAPAPEGTPAPAPEPVPMPDFNYYVWLADGNVVKTADIPNGARWTDNGADVAIVGVYPR